MNHRIARFVCDMVGHKYREVKRYDDLCYRVVCDRCDDSKVVVRREPKIVVQVEKPEC